MSGDKWKSELGTKVRASVTFTIKRDRVAPTVKVIAHVDGGRYTQGQVVAARFSCADQYALASCNGTVRNGASVATGQVGSHTFEVTATDRAGNRARKVVRYTVATAPAPPAPPPAPPAPDTRAPDVNVLAPIDGAQYEVGKMVVAQYSCSDNVAVATCIGTAPSGSAIATDTVGKHTFEVMVTDTAGNVTRRKAQYTVVDTKAPEITIAAPVANGTFAWGQADVVRYSCADNVAVVSCTADVPNGTALPTSGAPGPGTRTLTVQAKDAAGNTATKTVSYTVKPAGYYALTFDDGPNPTYTQKVLDALKSVNAKATFFLIGSEVQLYPILAKAELDAGMWIGNHTMTHAVVGPAAAGIPAPAADPSAEIKGASDAIALATGGTRPAFFRPPYGQYDAATIALVKSLGMELASWTTDPFDWCTPDVAGCPAQVTVDSIIANAVKVPAGGILDMHDDNQLTADATPQIVTRLRTERGLLPGKLSVTDKPQPGPWPPLPPYFVEAVAP